MTADTGVTSKNARRTIDNSLVAFEKLIEASDFFPTPGSSWNFGSSAENVDSFRLEGTMTGLLVLS